MTVKSLRKQLAAAIAMTLVATVALGSSTYAWFAINSKVTATGMNFKTQVSDNLFISPSSHNGNGGKINAESTFVTTMVSNDYSGVIVEPVSTKTGQDFYYSLTNNVNGDGQVKNSEWIQYNSEASATDGEKFNNAFSENYGVNKTNGTAVGFVDYVYQLKAVAGVDTTLNLTKLDLSYADETTLKNTSFRAAVFVTEAAGTGENNGGNYTVTASSGDKNKVVANETANWIFTSSDDGATASGINFTTDTVENAVVTGANSVEAMEYKTDDATFQVTAGTHYYQVVVRVWLEGQDKNCNNTTFAALDDGQWGLTTEWTLGGETTAAVNYMTVKQSVKESADLSGARKTETTKVINGITYAELDVSGYWVDNSADFTNGSRVYTIDTDNQITEVTHIVKLPAPATPSEP